MRCYRRKFSSSRWRGKRTSEAEALLNLELTRNNFQDTLKTVAEKGRADLIIQVFNIQLQKQSFVADERDYAVGILACARSKLWRDACQLLNRMPEVDLAANVFIYNAAISACGRKWQQALMLLRAMKTANVNPDVFIFSATISACEKGGQWQQASSLFQEMKIAQVTPNVISYNAMISAYEKGSQWQQALVLFGALKVVEVKPDVISYSATISACEKAGEWQQAIGLFQEMKTAEVEPNVISYSATISACQKGGQWQQAVSFLDAMDAAGVRPSVISYNATISACGTAGQWQQGLLLLDTMLASKVQPDMVSYSVLLDNPKIFASQSLGGRLFHGGLLPILKARGTVFHEHKLDLHGHSEGAARLSLQWWLSTTLLQRLASASTSASAEMSCKVVTGHGKSRQPWDHSDLQAAALEILRSYELKPWILNKGKIGLALTKKDLPKLQRAGRIFTAQSPS